MIATKYDMLKAVTIFTACLLLIFSFSISASAADQSYILGENDVVSVIVYAGAAQQVAADLTVDANGNLAVPMIGPVRAKGLSLAQLEQAIREPLSADYFVNPQVILTVKTFRSLSFFVTGAVEQPGRYEMDREITLMELIGKAGGLKAGYGHSAYITSSAGRESEGDATTEEVDLLVLLDSGGSKGNIHLKNGDMIQIPFKTEMDQAKTNIYIEGEIKNPGMYAYHPGLTALNACVMAGGFNQFAAPNRTKIMRKNGSKKEVIEINLEKVRKGLVKDIPLQPGDFINVPETWL